MRSSFIRSQDPKVNNTAIIMADSRNKRTALNVRDVINGDTPKSHSRFKSGYTGPKKAPKPSLSDDTGALYATGSLNTSYKSGGILDYAWIAYIIILAIALTTAIIAYTKGTGRGDGIYYPYHIPTVSGVVRTIFDDYRNGGLGSGYTESETQNTSGDDPATAGEQTDKSALLGENISSSIPNATTGAAMALDEGSAYGSYATATSYEELLEQIDTALSSNDPGFIGMKMAYADPDTDALVGYPQSVVEHFTQYMADNPDKRANFMAEIKDESKFSIQNKSAYLVKLPLLQFTINMGYDGTTISISGFSDQQMNAGQSAVVSPLLPCMYTIHAETAKGSQTSEVECNMNEGNLKINIGVTK